MRDSVNAILIDGLGKIPDALGAIVMDHDGLVVAERPPACHAHEWQMLATELARSISALAPISPVLGPLKQLVVTHQDMTTLIAPLAADTFLAVALSPDAILGRTQFYLNELINRLDTELFAA